MKILLWVDDGPNKIRRRWIITDDPLSAINNHLERFPGDSGRLEYRELTEKIVWIGDKFFTVLYYRDVDLVIVDVNPKPSMREGDEIVKEML